MVQPTEKMKTIRSAFLAGSEDLDEVRETVAKSWIRAQQRGVDPQSTDFGRLNSNPASIFDPVKRRPLLFDYIFSYLEKLYAQNDFSSYVLLVTNSSGYIINLYGNQRDLVQLKQLGLELECTLQEEITGTNAVGTCLYTHKPVYIQKFEHYNERLCGLTSYGAPIFDYKNNLMAAIGVLAFEKEHTPFLLSMLGNVADSIGKESTIYKRTLAARELEVNIDTLINTMDTGVIFLDNQGYITKANGIARYFLLLYEYELIGQHISVFISPQDIDFSKLQNNVYEQPVTVHTGSVKTFPFLLSVYLSESSKDCHGFTLVFQKEQSEREEKQKDTEYTAKWTFNDIVGTSPSLKEMLNHARIASKTTCNVLITGESGTGKELVAQAIHNDSQYAQGPFIAVNCGAIPKELIESELFGYESGAFTGAKKNGMPGKFELANGGTIFLDEIGDMPYNLQVVMLRFLQNREVTRIGGKKTINVNVRVIAATNKNLEEAINNGVFRMDLYYRLNVFTIHIPSLRERSSDIGNLAHYFLHKYKANSAQPFLGFTSEALNALQNYDWPGNIRELENTIERAVIVGYRERIHIDDLPERIRGQYNHRSQGFFELARSPIPEMQETIPPTPDEAEKEAILRVLHSTNGNVTRAAEELGISRRTIYRKMKKHNIT